MRNLKLGKQAAKTSLLYLAIAIALLAALPLLAALAYASRLLIPLLLVAAVVVLALSPAARAWLTPEKDRARDYKGLALPGPGLRLHARHGWVKIEGRTARVGADALGLAVLGPVGAIEIPALGTRIDAGAALFTLCRGPRRLQIKAPVSGVVAAVHRGVVEAPGKLHDDPYDGGWVVELHDVAAEPARSALFEGESLHRYFRAEVDRLLSILTGHAGPGMPATTMPDGGKLAPDLADRIDDAKWAVITGQLFA